MSTIMINSRISISEDEIRFTFSRSGGPGGQNVNKVSTRAILWFDVVNSPSLTPYQKSKIMQRLAGRISKEGILQISSGQYRTQKANRDDVSMRFTKILAAALVEKPLRKKTKITAAAKERRLLAKKRRSMRKTERSGSKW